MRIATADVEIEVDAAGDTGPAIMLVHGLGGSRRTWETLAAALAPAARVFVPDLRGCGDSTRGTRPWTLAQVADDIDEVARRLGLGAYVLVGHSLGGVIAQELLVRQPLSVAAAVLISTSSRLNEKATENWRRLADSVEARGLSMSADAAARGYSEEFAGRQPDIVAAHARIAAATDPKVYAEQARAASVYDYTTALARVACPVLVVQGLADRLTPPGGSVLLQRALPPNSRLEMIEGAGHNLPIERPRLMADKILAFANETLAEE
ncbi:MAG: alpha/beta fold hydrolase [Candidatus Binatia bacterium]